MVCIILTLLSFLFFILYNIISLLRFDYFPHSLSETYYLWEKTEDSYMKYLFCATLTICAGLLMPAWLDITAGSNLQFLSFLCCASLLFVAYAPNFKRKYEGTVHSMAAVVSAICGIIWCLFGIGITEIWNLAIVLLILALCIVLIIMDAKEILYKPTLKSIWASIKQNNIYIYCIEMWCFFSIYLCIIIYYYKNLVTI